MVAVGLAGVGVLLGTPRAVRPDEVPLPIPDERRLREAAVLDQSRALAMQTSSEQERSSGAGFDLRQLGAALGRYGEADAAGDSAQLSIERTELVKRAHGLLDRDGPEGLLRLRAYEQQVFLREVAHWEQTGEVSARLKQVGGGIVRTVTGSGWARPPGRAWSARPEVRAALFKRRFAEVLGLGQSPVFAPTLDEGRALYAFLLSSPPSLDGPTAWTWRLRKVDELGAFDPDYPKLYARGVVFLRLGQGPSAVAELREHLAQHPDGPSTLRARNALVAAVELAESQTGGP